LVKDPKSNRATPALAHGSCCRRCCRSDAKSVVYPLQISVVFAK
jgi:hypothetical protein